MNLHAIQRDDLGKALDYCRETFPSFWEWKIENNTISYIPHEAESDHRTEWTALSKSEAAYYIRVAEGRI